MFDNCSQIGTGRLKNSAVLAVLALTVGLVGACGSSTDTQTNAVPVATPSLSPVLDQVQPAPAPSATPVAQTTAPTTAPVELGELVSVLSVTDGDTIRVDYRGTNEPVRFIGIDTPEVARYGQRGECFGDEASDYARKKLSGAKVYLVRDGLQDDRDRYGRLLRFVFLEDQTNLNELMVRNGFATYEPQYPVAEPFRSGLVEAQRSAKSAGVGLWTACS